MNIFHHIPADFDVLGNSLNGTELQLIQHGQSKSLGKSFTTEHEREFRPPQMTTGLALQSMYFKFKNTAFSTDRREMELAHFPSLKDGHFTFATSAGAVMPGYFSLENYGVAKVIGGSILQTFQVKSMV